MQRAWRLSRPEQAPASRGTHDDSSETRRWLFGDLKLEDERDWLLARIAEKPDLTLDALVAELAD